MGVKANYFIQPLKKFVKEPWTSYNKGEADILNHCSLEYHEFAVIKGGEFLKVCTSTNKTVIELVDKQRNLAIENNRKRLVPIVKTVIMCGRQNLALRGHDDYGEFSSPEAQSSSLAGFHGIFRGLLAFRMDAGDNVLQEHFANCAKNATMISKRIQNEVIDVTGLYIQQSLKARLHRSKFFSILCDESCDISKHEQMSVCVRYVDLEDFVIREDFLGFKDVTSTTGEALKNSLEEFLETLGISLEYCRGQGYDGGSNMAGKFKGLQALILKERPLAFYTHCFSHNLNLTVSKACSDTLINNMMGVVAQVSAFVCGSAHRAAILKDAVEESEHVKAEKKKKLKPYCPTRWVERQDSLRNFKQLFHGIYDALEVIKISGDRKSSPNAMAFQAAISRTEFIVPLHIAVFVMSKTRRLSKALQGVDLDFSQALSMIDTVLEALKTIKANAGPEFREIFKEAQQMAAIVGTTLIPPRIVKRQNYRSKGLNSSAELYYLEALFIPFLDHFIDEISSRFGKKEADVFMLQGLIPSRLKDYSDEMILKGAKIYAGDLDSDSDDDLRTELLFWRTKWNSVKVTLA